MADEYSRLMIEALPQGGYIVAPGQIHPSDYTPILAAKTTLEEALDLVRRIILKHPESPGPNLADATKKELLP